MLLFSEGMPQKWVGSLREKDYQVSSEATSGSTDNFFKEAHALAKIGFWELDLQTRVRRWSGEVYAILGLDSGIEIDQLDISDFFDPWASETIQRAISEAISKGTQWDLELPVKSANGKELWVRTIGRVRYEGGIAVNLYGVLQDLTEYRALEDKISIIFRFSTNAHILLDEKGVWDCNQAALDLLGYQQKADLLHKGFDAISPVGHSDATDSIWETIAACRGQRDIHFEWVCKKQSGEPFPVEVTIKPVVLDDKELFLMVWHDLSAVKRAEERLRRSEAVLAQTQQLTKCGSWEKDLLTGESYWSQQTYRIFGMSKHSSGPPEDQFDSLLHPDDLQMFYAHFEKAIRLASVVDFEYRIMIGGNVRFVHVIVRPVTDASGTVVKLHGAVMDVDQQKRFELDLIDARKKADAANVAKSQFLSTMSHEIRTPLNAIIGFTNLLLRDRPASHQLEYLDLLKVSGENLLGLVNDILDFSKIEAGKVELEKVAFNLKQKLVSSHQLFFQAAAKKNLELVLLCADELDRIVIGDPIRFGQVITNLVSNAIKFTEKGSVVISASLNTESKGSISVEFHVRDTGIGIPEEKLEGIFDQFVQASADTTRRYGGSGLGLAIVKSLLQLQGGDISVQSQVGIGSSFSFTLGFETRDAFAGQTGKGEETPVSIEGIRILLAEDNEINIRLMENMFRRWKVDYGVARNGRMAFEMLMAEAYDVMLMDLQMPEWDGFTAASRIRALSDRRFQTIPIIALTASISAETKDLALAAGMTDYLIKPFAPAVLVEKIVKSLVTRVSEDGL